MPYWGQEEWIYEHAIHLGTENLDKKEDPEGFDIGRSNSILGNELYRQHGADQRRRKVG